MSLTYTLTKNKDTWCSEIHLLSDNITHMHAEIILLHA